MVSVALAIPVASPATASQAGPLLPQIQLPPVQVGPVQVGPVQVGPVKVPPVEVPPVKVPPVKVPPVEVPPVEAPPVPAAPQVPDAGSPAPASPGRPSSSRSPSSTAPSSPSSTPTSPAAASAPAGDAAVTSAAARARRAAPPSARRGTPQVRRAVRRERVLRATVERLQGCLGGVSAAERKVLVLRSGLGAAPARTRHSVARTLDVGVRRVGRIERRGLRHVRALARTGGCGGATAPATASGTATAGDVQLASDTGAVRTGQASSKPTSGVAQPEGGDVRGAAGTKSPLPPAAIGSVSPTDVSFAIILVLLAAIAGFAAPHVQDRLKRR